jgi:hypothetical protein
LDGAQFISDTTINDGLGADCPLVFFENKIKQATS